MTDEQLFLARAVIVITIAGNLMFLIIIGSFPLLAPQMIENFESDLTSESINQPHEQPSELQKAALVFVDTLYILTFLCVSLSIYGMVHLMLPTYYHPFGTLVLGIGSGSVLVLGSNLFGTQFFARNEFQAVNFAHQLTNSIFTVNVTVALSFAIISLIALYHQSYSNQISSLLFVMALVIFILNFQNLQPNQPSYVSMVPFILDNAVIAMFALDLYFRLRNLPVDMYSTDQLE